MRAALGQPADADAIDAAFRAVLADHRIPEDDERPNSASCVHLDTFGTRSSCLVRVGCGRLAAPHVGGAGPAVHDALRRRRRRCGAGADRR